MKKRIVNVYLIVLPALLLLIVFYFTQRDVQTQETEPQIPGAVFTVANSLDAGAGSLRQAIIDANTAAGTDTIRFQIGTGPVAITPASALPDVTQPVIIDGTTQPGFSGIPLIRLAGANGGLRIVGGGSTVRSIAVVNTSVGITLENVGGNIIVGSYVGICPQSVVANCGNLVNGIRINNSPNNQIGGSTVADRNNIGLNVTNGILITGAASSGNVITGNLIGILADDTIRRNRETGVRIDGAPNNRVGGTTAGERNVISTNGFQTPSNLTESGVLITGAGATGNVVQGNYIGTRFDGTDFTLAAVNTWNGVRIEGAADNTIGGTVGTTPGGGCTGVCNLISGFAGNGDRSGVTITGSGATGNSVIGNFIGTSPAGGSSIVGNNVGVTITVGASSNTVGGTTAAGRNLIGNGIRLLAGAASNTVQGNYIGTDTTGNIGIGLLIAENPAAVLIDSAPNNRIGTAAGTTLGGACTGGCNLISGNNLNGLRITGSGSTGNRVDYNYIGLNGSGTAALRNGGDAISLQNGANNNTIGRPLNYSYQSTTPAPTTTYLVQDDQTGNYIQFDTLTGQFSVKFCRGELIDGGTGRVRQTETPTSVFLSGPLSSGFLSFDTATGKGSASIIFFNTQGDTIDRISIRDENISNNEGNCPAEGMQIVLGSVANNASNNTFNFFSLGSTANGLVNLSSPTADGNFFHSGGSFNTYSNLFVDTNGSNFAPIAIASGTDNLITRLNINALNPGLYTNLPIDLNDNQVRDPNDPQDPDGGANRTQNSPIVTNIRREQDGGVRISYTFNTTPNTRFRLSFYNHQFRGGGQYSPTTLLHVLEGVMTDANGNSTSSVLLTGPEAQQILSRRGGLYVLATVVNQVPIAGENSAASFIDVPGDTSELSPLVALPQPRFDFDNDGKTDISVYRPGASAEAFSFWYVLKSSDFTFRVVQFGNGEDRPVTGDFQGDGTADFAVFRPSNGTWYYSRITGNPTTNYEAVPWGISTDTPVVGDFDDDGANDPAVFRNGIWYVRRSLGGTAFIQSWGLATDKPVPADYDGDGDSDIAVYRNGIWYISPCPTCPLRVENFGLANDVPVPGDYDGDGRDDIAVWRPSTGVWYLMRSTAGFSALQFGLSSDKAVAGDFDADGKSDVAVWRPSTGTSYVLRSEQGILILNWGSNGDIPVGIHPGQ